ncbi:hypothetical protein ACQHIV_41990 [Kribbella sp. GL6]|uniref:hypothetical protein n=1 Tax=Kribbella sp. GL6 TaxID=3419765 RepID=UPI003CFE670D
MTRRWLIDLPTRIHLWTAELELRHRPSADPERRRNLDVLRAYRKSRAFPRNDTGLRSTPYFVDSAGRHCAVGQLMRMSGARDAVRRIAAEANLARLDAMDPAVLADWTKRSGLTNRELARIQPTYGNESQWAVDVLLWSALVMLPLALLSYLLGRIRSQARPAAVIAVVALCTVLTYVMWGELSGAGSGSGLLEWSTWCLVLVGPLLGAGAIAWLVRAGRIADEAVPSASGLLTGGLATLFAAVYLVLDVVVPDPSDPAPGVISMGPDQPILWAAPALVALVAGLVTLAWARRTQRRA